MRYAALVAALIGLGLAACTPPAGDAPGDAEGGAQGLAAAFPNMSNAAYRADIVSTNDDGEEMPIVMIRDGAKMRMEFESEQGRQIFVSNPDANETFIIMNAGGREMVIRTDTVPMTDYSAQWSDTAAGGAAPTRAGTCNVAGESGNVWQEANPEPGDTADTACLTDDGILLEGTDNGAVRWRATSVARGPQDPALFQAPAGAMTLDPAAMMGPGGAEAMEKMKQQFGQ